MNKNVNLNRRHFLRTTGETAATLAAAAAPAILATKADLPKGYQRGKTPWQPNHMVDWVNCIRSRGIPKCSTDETFVETATFLMSLKSQQERRMMCWDAAREEIV